MRDRSADESPSAWLADALQALAELDDEIVEDGLPAIGPSARKEAERIIVGLARQPWAPTVYPTRDAEVAIHFKSPDSPGSMVLLLDNHGRGVMEHLAALMPRRLAVPAARGDAAGEAG